MKNDAQQRIEDNDGWEIEGMNFNEDSKSETKIESTSFSYNKKRFELDNSQQKK